MALKNDRYTYRVMWSEEDKTMDEKTHPTSEDELHPQEWIGAHRK